MILDATTFKPELTAEAALGIIQKEITRRGWRKFDVTEIRLVYTPYWTFSFDVLADNATPTGKAAINATTGDMDENIPTILERPLKKTKETDGAANAEVEPTNISKADAEKVTPFKVAASVGLKKENVAVSAISKVYLPAYRVWFNIDGVGDFKASVDALLGIPAGTEQVPSKGKTWDESTSETIDRMKTPAGFASLAGEAVAGAGGGGAVGGLLGNKYVLWAAMIIAIVVLLTVYNGGTLGLGGVDVTCTPESRFLGDKPFLGMFGQQPLKPSTTVKGDLYVRGTCTFRNSGNTDVPKCIKVQLYMAGAPTPNSNSTCAVAKAGSGLPVEREFTITWSGSRNANYELKVS